MTPEDTTPTDERAAFEAWWASAGYDNSDQWHAWQARASLSPSPAAGEARIDPMQDPMRPGYFMSYAEDESPAEMVLRKLACWLGVGGYNAPTVDADLFHRKIVDGVEMMLRSAALAAPPAPSQPAPAQAVPLDDHRLQELFSATIDGALTTGYQGGEAPPAGHWLAFWYDKGRAVAEAEAAAPVQAVPLTDEQIDRHSLPAGSCPPNSQVMLVSSIRRILGITGEPKHG